MKYLITGGCGFLGTNIADYLLSKRKQVVIFDNLYRFGSSQNLEWLKLQGDFTFVHGDIRNQNDVLNLIKGEKPDVIFHLAGQVAMTTSIANPRFDFEVNVLGTFNLLDSVRIHAKDAIVIYASTNKVYGDLEQFHYEESETRYICVDKPNGFDESISLDFHSPYGVSKGSADQYVLDFARIYNLNTVVFRHSSMYGGRQFSTYDQGWIGWFIAKAIEIRNRTAKEPFTISGNGKQVRDILHASDAAQLYLLAAEKISITKGQVFNVGGGVKNAFSILELLKFLEETLDVEMSYRCIPVRESDQKIFIADLSKLKKLLDWYPDMTKEVGVRETINPLLEIHE